MEVYDDRGNPKTLTDGDKCPRSGAWLIPRGYLTAPPPPSKKGKIRVWDGSKWSYENTPISEKTRQERNARLYASDWTQLADAPLSREKKAKYKAYRQALRDLPDLEAWPAVEWPSID